MDNGKRIETRNVPEKAPTSRSGVHPDTVKLVEMGDISVETKGTVRGLELGLTPKS
jgi:hypothetical protein